MLYSIVYAIAASALLILIGMNIAVNFMIERNNEDRRNGRPARYEF